MHMPGEFYDYSWVFHLIIIARVTGARLAEERSERKIKNEEDDETGFSPLLGLSLKQRFFNTLSIT